MNASPDSGTSILNSMYEAKIEEIKERKMDRRAKVIMFDRLKYELILSSSRKRCLGLQLARQSFSV